MMHVGGAILTPICPHISISLSLIYHQFHILLDVILLIVRSRVLDMSEDKIYVNTRFMGVSLPV
jgi:hypothetical protein